MNCPFVYGNDAAVTLAFLGGTGIDVAHQYAFGGQHQGIRGYHFACSHGGDASLVDDGF